MSKIEIQGEGIYILLQLLDEETASAYASKGQLTSNEYDNFMDESDGHVTGFYGSSQITVDGIEIGTVEDIINLGKNLPNGPILAEGLSKELELKIKNGLVDEQLQEGTFVSVEIPDYSILEDGTPSTEFIKDFIQSLTFEEDSCAYRLTNWNEVELEAYEDTNGYPNLSLFYQGIQYEIEITEDEDWE